MAEEIKKELENEDVEPDKEESGSEDSTKKEDAKGSDKSGSNDNNNKDKTFTQEQVNRMMTREKNQGRNAVYNELGINPKDANQLKQVKAYLESLKTDEEKETQAQVERDNALTEANQRAQIAEAKAEAMMLGVKTQYVDDVVILALSKMTEDSDLKTIIGEFKTKYPIWFGESEKEEEKNNKSKVGQKGTGSSVKVAEKGGSAKEEKGLGARLAAQRKSGSGKKSSYWGNH